jgi:RNA polymerase-binding transcription factor DksA
MKVTEMNKRELERFQKRIERGTCGTCEECSARIPTKRLEAYLPARLCVPSRARLEKARRA